MAQNLISTNDEKTYTCVELGSAHLPWGFSPDGTAQLRATERTNTRTWTIELPAQQA
ncbi:hypothetical protein [Frankia sp. AgB32]|uniref:hypothetical protein n=1 Tax=Frankia sp. AgB32 TaxID=631119 RepID=UPI00200C6810|nr:hypothetical protein [Frankia sp. AgB32]MCK9897910.1 hypothetical protein [Frankia sp. AgB32]